MEKIGRTKIVDLLKSEAFDTTVCVKGWVRTKRGNKNVNFIALNDGSCLGNIQIVVDVDNFDEELLKKITTGAAISVVGTLVASQGQQKCEVLAKEVEVLGEADPNTYPLQKKGHTLEFLREIAHLRPRTNTFGAVFRMRHELALAVQDFFDKRGSFYFHALTCSVSDWEGAAPLFMGSIPYP